MMNRLFVFIVVILVVSVVESAVTERQFTGMVERRGPVSYEFGVNILTKLNAPYTFPLVIGSNFQVSLWLLTRQTNQSFQSNQTQPSTLALYDPRQLPRNVSLAAEFGCLPSEQECRQININQLGLDDLGVYTFRFDSRDYLTNENFQFNVSAYLSPIQFSCLNSSLCSFNASTQTLSVIADQAVQLKCNVPIVQNDNYPVSAQLNFVSESSASEECIGASSLTPQSSVPFSLPRSNFNIIVNQLSKTCTRTFGRQELLKSYSCQLNPTPISATETAQYQRNSTYEVADIKLDVQFGPDPTTPLNPIPPSSQSLFNKTVLYGLINQASFSCPFTGNPAPNFYWRVISVPLVNATPTTTRSVKRSLSLTREFTPGPKDFPIPSDLDLGTYVFECRSQVLGLINNSSQAVQFTLNVNPQPTNPPILKSAYVNPESRYMQNKDGTNVGAIVGGIIGGIALLILVVLGVLLLLRHRRNQKNSKDGEIEKAKEIDIDITDHDVSNRKSSTNSSNGLVQPINGQLQNGGIHHNNKQPNGIGHKVIAGLMVPSSTAQSYAAIAHAAAAAAQSNLHRNHLMHGSESNNINYNSSGSSNNLFSSNSNNNLLTNSTKSQSYNNPGFFESTTYPIQNPLESPPPYDAALQQPVKKDSPIQQQHRFQQQQQQQQLNHKDYMGSNSRLLGPNTPNGKNPSLSYTANTPQQNALSLVNSTPTMSSSLQQLQYQQQIQQQQQPNLQYTSVHNLENRARSRNPLNGGLTTDLDNQQTQYSALPAQLNLIPTDV